MCILGIEYLGVLSEAQADTRAIIVEQHLAAQIQGQTVTVGILIVIGDGGSTLEPYQSAAEYGLLSIVVAGSARQVMVDLLKLGQGDHARAAVYRQSEDGVASVDGALATCGGTHYLSTAVLVEVNGIAIAAQTGERALGHQQYHGVIPGHGPGAIGTMVGGCSREGTAEIAGRRIRNAGTNSLGILGIEIAGILAAATHFDHRDVVLDMDQEVASQR